MTNEQENSIGTDSNPETGQPADVVFPKRFRSVRQTEAVEIMNSWAEIGAGGLMISRKKAPGTSGFQTWACFFAFIG